MGNADVEWELNEGVPQVEDPFIQKYISGRNALIQEEKRQRHDFNFRQSMSPAAAVACRIVSRIREKERNEIWTKNFEESLAHKSDEVLYQGMMFNLAKDRMEKTDLWKIVQRMPKGSLLHAHMDAMFDIDFLVEQALSTPGIHMRADVPLDTIENLKTAPINFQYNSAPEAESKGKTSIWESKYTPGTLIHIQTAASTFPGGGFEGFRKWLESRCMLTLDTAFGHHHGVDAIWSIFQRTFPIVGSILYYEPIFRACMRRMLTQIHADGIRYSDFRIVLHFEYRRQGSDSPEPDYIEFFRVFKDEIEKFKSSEEGKGFQGGRIIWTALRRANNQVIVESMKQCILAKKTHPDMIAGFDVVGQEEQGRPLVDLIPVLFWFRKRCVEEQVEIPFFFHAGECLGDGDPTDSNLFDAILLGTRRIGHGFSLYKHPLLVDLVKEKKILVECCPISNEILRLTNSILSHPLPALLARGVTVSLNNDDPAILGHGKNGLTHDFWQAVNGLDNMGLEGLATMAENSVRWSCFEDQTSEEWLRDIKEGITGSGLKAERLKEWHIKFEEFCQWVVSEFGTKEDDLDEGKNTIEK